MMDLHPGLMLWTIVSFVILLLLLKKVAWEPILKALDEREKGIKDNIDAAKRAREDADKSLAEYKEKLKEAHAEAQDLVVKARVDAEHIREELIAKSKAEADALIQRAIKEIDSKRQEAISQIRGEIASLVILSAEKIITKSLNDDDHKRLVMQSLENLN